LERFELHQPPQLHLLLAAAEAPRFEGCGRRCGRCGRLLGFAALKLLLVWMLVLLAGSTVGQVMARVARRAELRR
jgi:hypothetical protein